MALQMQQRLAANIADLDQLDRLEHVLARLELRQPIPARGSVNLGHLIPRVEICFQPLVHRTRLRTPATLWPQLMR